MSEDTASGSTLNNDGPASENGQPPVAIGVGMAEPLPALHTPHRKRKIKLLAGVILATLDLACLPIVYYYALNFGTSLSLQDVFAVITGVYGLISFTHYFFRSLKLFRRKTAPRWRPVGWTRWGILEFLEVNILIVITLVEIELIAGTAPSKPFIRVCAMPSPTICFYLGFLFCGSAILTQMGKRLPFNMSSTEKGSVWRPALLAFIEDAGAIEGQGGVQYRTNVMRRYEVSPFFRRMILLLSWGWGLGFLCIATVATVLIMELEEDIGFGVGWGLPWIWGLLWSFLTVWFVKRSLEEERAWWRNKEVISTSAV